MAKLSFGVGGYGGRERVFLAEITSSSKAINNLLVPLQDVGFWTVVSNPEVSEKTSISIGEVKTYG